MCPNLCAYFQTWRPWRWRIISNVSLMKSLMNSIRFDFDMKNIRHVWSKFDFDIRYFSNSIFFMHCTLYCLLAYTNEDIFIIDYSKTGIIMKFLKRHMKKTTTIIIRNLVFSCRSVFIYTFGYTIIYNIRNKYLYIYKEQI